MHRGYAGFGNNVTDRHQFGAHPEDLDVIGSTGSAFRPGDWNIFGIRLCLAEAITSKRSLFCELNHSTLRSWQRSSRIDFEMICFQNLGKGSAER